MNNEEILNALAEIRKLPNVCARSEALVDLEPKYKKSAFFKKTHKSLQVLYYETWVEDLLTLRSLLNSTQTFLNELDTSTLQEALENINEDSIATMTQGIELFNSSGLADLIKKS